MNNDVYTFALKSTLEEIQSACPNVSNTFIFKDGKLLAKGETTDEKTVNRAINAFNSITERADAIGGVEAVTIQGANGRVNIACMNELYLATVLSKKADEKYVKTLTRVLIPTVIKLVEKVHPASADDETRTVELEPAEDEIAEEDTERAEDDDNEATEEKAATTETAEEEEIAEEEETAEVDDESLLPEPPVTQFIVEDLSGLLISPDTVRIDKEVIAEWNDLYGDKKISEVDIETLEGITTRCKLKPIKDSKYKGKGIIRVPEKLQLTLEAKKGDLVMVKPVVE